MKKKYNFYIYLIYFVLKRRYGSGKKGFGLIITTRNNVMYVRPAVAAEAWVERAAAAAAVATMYAYLHTHTHTYTHTVSVYIYMSVHTAAYNIILCI